MTRPVARLVAAAIAAAVLSLVPAGASAQAKTPPPPLGKPGAKGAPAASKPSSGPAGPAETRFRLVLNFAVAPGTTSYEDVRTPVEYAETSTIRTSYEAGTGLGPDVALQVSLYRGLGLLAGYSHITRDATGTVDVARPHPLYLNRPRTASAELSGYGYTQGAFDLDAAYARSAGSFDWALFAGVTFFKVEADLLDVPTYSEAYPYDQLSIVSTPAGAIQENATGFNVGGRLDYRFGQSKRFGAGIQLRYSNASVELKASQASTPATIDAGGLTIGAGVRVYF
jgi:hypothetical protein